MPKYERHSLGKGIYYIEGTHPHRKGASDRIYYGRWETKDRETGKRTNYDERIGRASQGWTEPKARKARADMMQGKETTGKQIRQKKAERANAYTLCKLWDLYATNRKPGKGLESDRSRYHLYIEKPFGDLLPEEITPQQVDRLRKSLIRQQKSPQTINHILNLLSWITNHGWKQHLCKKLDFHIELMPLNNKRVDTLDREQYRRLLEAVKADTHPVAGDMIRLALIAGLRRGEMFKLQWNHIDFDSGYLTLFDPKGGEDKRIKMNEPTRKLLTRIKENASPCKSAFVFPGKTGKQRVDIAKPLRKIREAAGLPKSWRPLHSMRHVYASMMASSGEVDLNTLREMLGHADTRMTQRYSHLLDHALQRAADTAGKLFEDVEV